MSRMNQSKPITGRQQNPQADTHSAAVAEAFEEGLAEFAAKLPDGRPMLFSSRQRAEARRRKAKILSELADSHEQSQFEENGHAAFGQED